MNKVVVFTTQITQSDVTQISSKGAFKVKVRNESSGLIVVAGCPIASGESETFDGLAPGDVFKDNLEINLQDSIAPEVYVTTYRITNDKC